jgi:rare lipoprotein A
LAAFFAAFLVAFFIELFSVTSKLCDPKRSHCDLFINVFRAKVKKKMHKRLGASTVRRRFASQKHAIHEMFLVLVWCVGMQFTRLLKAIAACALLAGTLCNTGCSKRKTGKLAKPVMPHYTETGIASWYGHPYHGRAAANGEIYDMEKMTAAHRTLPFETVVRVTRLDNGKAAEVRITDRGPFIDGRVIDLSHAAAKAIDMIGPGTARVRIDALTMPAIPAAGSFGVQVGAFRDKHNADRLQKHLARSYSPVTILPREGAEQLWRVVVGLKPTIEEAQMLADSLRVQESKALVVRLD